MKSRGQLLEREHRRAWWRVAWTVNVRNVLIVGAAWAALGAAVASAKPPGTVLAELTTPSQVAARDGVVAWTEYAAVTRTSTLVVRDAVGTRRLPWRGGFGLTLGTDSAGRVLALYAGCGSRKTRSCRLYRLDLATGAERLLPTGRGSVRAAAHRGALAWVRRDEQGVPRLRLGRLVGGPSVERRLPTIFDDYSVPPGPIPRSDIAATDLDLRDGRMLYRLEFGLGECCTANEVWLDTGRSKPRRIARLGTGGSSSGERRLLGARLYGSSIVLYYYGNGDLPEEVQRRGLGGRVIAHAPYAPGDGPFEEIHDAAYDRGRLFVATMVPPSAGEGCSPEPDLGPPQPCLVIDSGALRFTTPAANKSRAGTRAHAGR